jgi:hypothetical protein
MLAGTSQRTTRSWALICGFVIVWAVIARERATAVVMAAFGAMPKFRRLLGAALNRQKGGPMAPSDSEQSASAAATGMVRPLDVPSIEGVQHGSNDSFMKDESGSVPIMVAAVRSDHEVLNDSYSSAISAYESSFDPYAQLEEKRRSWLAKLEDGAGNDTNTATIAPSRSETTEGVVVPTATSKSKQKTKEPKREAWREGIFAPAVLGAKQVLGEQKLKEVRAAVITKHSKVIADFVDTSESQFGQLVLKRMFEYADKDGNGTLDKEEVRAAIVDLGFDFLDEKQVDKLMKSADADKNEVIDFEEFVAATPKALRVNLVKLAKKNGHDLGFLV